MSDTQRIFNIYGNDSSRAAELQIHTWIPEIKFTKFNLGRNTSQPDLATYNISLLWYWIFAFFDDKTGLFTIYLMAAESFVMRSLDA